MARAQKEQASAKSKSPGKAAQDELPPVVPPRKQPLLLAIAVTLFVAWIGFLIALAIRG